ncbi:ADP-ribose pyrophosphatase YjhB (NUDIX family) [Nonomuraea polychroma]|uniref:ADP-ribose pyrophosphatase YjhB (NUDIX family) n=1 Tax=Nonomuraea polychroma TaxID=46176 RepID=A0A438M3I4_9ACTN|nr:NUDIX domain-containing protein [Nonomuraea polychroma]RVX40416.1 ADP-ribose pyrophosphatase YjhB (NUDIX family) [Nonomuraea polychroma]
MTHDGDAGVPGSLARVLAEVAAERAAQDKRWGMQELPDGTGGGRTTAASDRARQETETAARDGALTWRHVLAEEVLEAFAEADPDRLRAELIQVAAVAVKWTQALDRRHGPTVAPAPGRFRAIVDVHVVLLRGDTILLARRSGTGYGDGLWHLPSGHLEEGEPATHGAAREAAEELGVTIDPADLTFAHVMHRAPDRVGLFFTTGTWTGEPYNAEPRKCSEIAWWPVHALPADMIDYPAAAIANILGRIPFAQHHWSTSP